MAGKQGMTRVEAEGFVYKEARMLDTGSLEEWLKIFSADGIYWVPIDEHTDPGLEPSNIYDDVTQRAKRVHQLLQGSHYVQVPPSRTVHFNSNFEIENSSNRNQATTRCNCIIYELRPGDHQGLQIGLG